jgi:hypothetical protein
LVSAQHPRGLTDGASAGVHTDTYLADEIRPDWEQKLNSVKAAAARRASRRIVMRQVSGASAKAS